MDGSGKDAAPAVWSARLLMGSLSQACVHATVQVCLVKDMQQQQQQQQGVQ